MKEEGFKFDVAYTSVLKRAIKTLNNALETMGDLWVPTHKSWRLNEKSYGALQGLNKAETAAKFLFTDNFSEIEAFVQSYTPPQLRRYR